MSLRPDRDHLADARRIALDHIDGLTDASPMLMADVLDADLTDHDTDLIAEDLGILVGMLRDLVIGWDGGGDA